MTAVTREADAILHALIIISSSIKLSLISPEPDCTMYTSSPRTDSPISTLKRLYNISNYIINNLCLSLQSIIHLAATLRWSVSYPKKCHLFHSIYPPSHHPFSLFIRIQSQAVCETIFKRMSTNRVYHHFNIIILLTTRQSRSLWLQGKKTIHLIQCCRLCCQHVLPNGRRIPPLPLHTRRLLYYFSTQNAWVPSTTIKADCKAYLQLPANQTTCLLTLWQRRCSSK